MLSEVQVMADVNGGLVELNGMQHSSPYSLSLAPQLLPLLPLQSLSSAVHMQPAISQMNMITHGSHRLVSPSDVIAALPSRRRHEHHPNHPSRSPSPPSSRDMDKIPSQERLVRRSRQSCEDVTAVVGNSRRTSSSGGGKNSFLINDILGVVGLPSDVRRDDEGSSREVHHSSSTYRPDAEANRHYQNVLQSRKFATNTSPRINTSCDQTGTTFAIFHSTSEVNRQRPFGLSSSDNDSEIVQSATCNSTSINDIQSRLTSAIPLLSSGCHGDLASSVVVSSNKTPLPSIGLSRAVRPIPLRPSDASIGFENCVTMPSEQQSVYHQLQAAAAGLTAPAPGAQNRQIYAMHHQQLQQSVHDSSLPVHPGSVYGHHNHSLVMPHIPAPSFMGLSSDSLQTAAAAAAFYLNTRHNQLMPPCEFVVNMFCYLNLV